MLEYLEDDRRQQEGPEEDTIDVQEKENPAKRCRIQSQETPVSQEMSNPIVHEEVSFERILKGRFRSQDIRELMKRKRENSMEKVEDKDKENEPVHQEIRQEIREEVVLQETHQVMCTDNKVGGGLPTPVKEKVNRIEKSLLQGNPSPQGARKKRTRAHQPDPGQERIDKFFH